jgi:hypothetical protein
MNTAYEEYLAKPTTLPQSAPLASFSGEEAERVAALMLDPDTDADDFYRTVLGRPTLNERLHGRERSVQRNIRLPKPMDNYVSEAVHREGLSNRSEYFRLLVERDAKQHQGRTLVGA